MKAHGGHHYRECRSCDPGCTAGEVIHKRGYCSRCSCEEFVEKRNHFAAPTLTTALAHRVKKQPHRFLDQGRVEA